MEDCPRNLSIRVNLEKSSSTAVYEYFSSRLVDMETSCVRMDFYSCAISSAACVCWLTVLFCFSYDQGPVADLVELKDRSRIEMVLKCIEDGDLRRWSLPDIRAFNIGLSEWRSKLNCITNPYMYEQVWLVYLFDFYLDTIVLKLFVCLTIYELQLSFH